MRHTPPEPLVELLGRLGLASPDNFRAAAGRARRLARGLPMFESVWIDALAQTGVLTAFQAAEINARRGEQLRTGPYVLQQPLGSLQYAETYSARNVETGQSVLLAIHDMTAKSPQESAEVCERLQKLVVDSGALDFSSGGILPVAAADVDGNRAWAVCRAAGGSICDARSAAEWIIHNGRFPPPAVLEIAREMTAALSELHRTGLSHGDIRAETLLLTVRGRVLLPQPGLRAVFRPAESPASAELAPEAYDGLAPERSVRAAAAGLSSDIFACGCLWWHLLTARPALSGGNGLAKMRSAQTLDIPSVKPLAPDTSPELAAAIESCVARDPSARPKTFEDLSEILGVPVRGGRRSLVRSLDNVHGPGRSWTGRSASSGMRQTAAWLAGIAAVGAIVATVVWLTMFAKNSPEIASQTPTQQTPGKKKPDKNSTSSSHLTKTETITSPRPAVDVRPGKKLTGRQPGKRLLEVEAPTDVAALKLSPGQTVSPKGTGRARLLVSRGGLIVNVGDVCFENIDFVYKQKPDDKPAGGPKAEKAACIDLRAPSIQFRGCTFSADQSSQNDRPAAIRWTHPLDPSAAELSLPSGSIRLENCVFDTVSTAVDCRTAAAISIRVVNVLHLGNGPLVRLDRAPRGDEPYSLHLSRTTLRDSGPLMQCPCAADGSKPGRISIEAIASVLIPSEDNGLLSFVGRSSPKPILDQIEWTGQGSLVTHKTPIAQWFSGPQEKDAKPQTLDDASVAIAGLVRGKAEFAASADKGIPASRVIQWQAPLQTPEPPGVDVGLMPKGAP